MSVRALFVCSRLRENATSRSSSRNSRISRRDTGIPTRTDTRQATNIARDFPRSSLNFAENTVCQAHRGLQTTKGTRRSMRASSLPISSSSASARNRSDRGRCCWRWCRRRRCFTCAKLRCAEADVERCENCCSLIFNAHSLRTHGDRTPCRRVENSSDMRVAAASVSQLLLKSEKLNSSETRGALRRGALPWASGAV